MLEEIIWTNNTGRLTCFLTDITARKGIHTAKCNSSNHVQVFPSNINVVILSVSDAQ